jgi:hypothetical protein
VLPPPVRPTLLWPPISSGRPVSPVMVEVPSLEPAAGVAPAAAAELQLAACVVPAAAELQLAGCAAPAAAELEPAAPRAGEVARTAPPETVSPRTAVAASAAQV